MAVAAVTTGVACCELRKKSSKVVRVPVFSEIHLTLLMQLIRWEPNDDRPVYGTVSLTLYGMESSAFRSSDAVKRTCCGQYSSATST